MSTQISRLGTEDKWIAYQSSTMSAYSPIFYEELAARLFARYYGSRTIFEWEQRLEQAQVELGADAAEFVNYLLDTDSARCEETLAAVQGWRWSPLHRIDPLDDLFADFMHWRKRRGEALALGDGQQKKTLDIPTASMPSSRLDIEEDVCYATTC